MMIGALAYTGHSSVKTACPILPIPKPRCLPHLSCEADLNDGRVGVKESQARDYGA